MLTSLKLVIAAAATLATGTYAWKTVPTFQGESTKPRLQLASQEVPKAEPKDERLDRRVSVNISGTAADVVKWLTEQGVSFVVNNDELTKGSLTLNMVNQPLGDVVNAIADALGGHWQKRGDVYVFQAGRGGFTWTGEGIPDWAAPELKNLPNMKGFQMVVPKSGEFAIPNMKGFKFDLPKDAKGQLFIAPGQDGDFKIDLKGLKELKELKNLQGEKGQLFVMPGKDGELKIDLKGLQNLKIDAKTRQEIEKAMKDSQKLFQSEEFKRGFKDLDVDGVQIHTADVGKLIKTVTPAQWSKQKSQGYLKLSDLTPAQQKMLGQPKGKGDWNVQFVVDGKKLSIRGN